MRHPSSIANGHHRVALAKRLGDVDMEAYILESKDGYTFEKARKVGAELNIMEGQGDIYDHAEYFRQEKGITREQAGSRKLQKSSFAVGRDLEGEAYAAFANKRITAAQAIGIATGAPKNEGVQATALVYLSRNPRATELETANFVRLENYHMKWFKYERSD
ncbi:hypothetical protein MNBD_NITROSPINAE02-203 [hydrothermal vent metagenome]|uniref:ParB/Sulfiredoxin domain-containing protein n=1 Tax=hydrothermal vent metagenome TaxID=652676 RepID=A0A3B1CL97_9ZZZZ